MPLREPISAIDKLHCASRLPKVTTAPECLAVAPGWAAFSQRERQQQGARSPRITAQAQRVSRDVSQHVSQHTRRHEHSADRSTYHIITNVTIDRRSVGTAAYFAGVINRRSDLARHAASAAAVPESTNRTPARPRPGPPRAGRARCTVSVIHVGDRSAGADRRRAPHRVPAQIRRRGKAGGGSGGRGVLQGSAGPPRAIGTDPVTRRGREWPAGSPPSGPSLGRAGW